MAELGTLFSKSWHDVIDNIKDIALATLWLLAVPILIVGLIAVFAVNISLIAAGALGAFAFLLIIVMSLIYTSGVIRVFLAKQKISWRKIRDEGVIYIFKFLGVQILLLIIYILLLGLCAIPVIVAFVALGTWGLLVGIPMVMILIVLWLIVGTYLAFAIYFALDDKASVGESLKKSTQLVKGSFWPVLGFTLLVGILVGAVSSIAGMVLLPLRIGMQVFWGMEMYQIAIILGAFYLSLTLIISSITKSYLFAFMANYYKTLSQEKVRNLRKERIIKL